MTTCDSIVSQLTAYLDGELADDDGSAVRGHLRECAACRQLARDEAALRDALRVLPPVDPPATLWAGVQAQLAAAEVADARTPRWRRAIARWMPRFRAAWLPSMPQLAVAGLLAVAGVSALYWRTHRGDELATTDLPRLPMPEIQTPHREPAAAPAAALTTRSDDVTAELAAEPARVTGSYGEVIDELTRLAEEARGSWSDERKAAFDGRLAALAATVAQAQDGRPRQRAQRSMIRFLQGAVVRDEVVLASGGSR